MSTSAPEVIIVGAGPAGCALAAMLAMRGKRVLVFDDAQRPELLVGESLIPAVVNIFRTLGIEERVKEFCLHKPGASFLCAEGVRMDFDFRNVDGHLPPYSYNAPRPALDNLIRQRAEELGAKFVKARAEVLRADRDGQPSVKLSDASRAVAGLKEGDDPLLVDSTGRARVFARTMGLKSSQGPRNDVAHFAHFENFDHDEVPLGQPIITVLSAGWSWRIPLPDRLSVGIVVNKERAKQLGNTPEERLENAIKQEPLLKEKGRNAKRITDVMTYTNYQLLTERGYGPGWVLLGDAFGFVDPMLSPGVFLSLEGARLLDELYFGNGERLDGLVAYDQAVKDWHRGWSFLVERFYNGQVTRAWHAGDKIDEGASIWQLSGMIGRIARFQVASMAGGGYTRSLYSQNFVRFLCRYVVKDVPDAEFFAVKG